MANTKISALPASTTPLAGTEVLPIVQSSTTKQVSVANLTAGRAVATGALSVTGAATVSTTLAVTGAATLSSTLGVTGAATLSSTLGVAGATTLFSVATTSGTIATAPSGSTDIANKAYVDTVAQGLDTKASVVAGTTANITLSGTQTIDGVVLIAGDRVLVKNQTTTANNGLYLCAAGSWTRTTDMDTWAEVPGAYVFVEQGTTLADTGWVCTSDAGGTIGVTAIVWAQFSGAGSGVSSINFGSTGLTPSGVTTGAVTVAGTLAVANGGTGITSFGTGIATFLGTPSSANLRSALTDETGTGSAVFATSPTLVTPLLGTPTSGVATNLTGLPLTTGVTGTLPIGNGGTGLTSTPANGALDIGNGTGFTRSTLTAGSGITITNGSGAITIAASGGGGTPGGSTTQVQYNNAGAFGGITGATTNGTALTLVAPVLGTPASATLTNATGLPLTTGVTGVLPAANGGSQWTTSGSQVYFTGSIGVGTSAINSWYSDNKAIDMPAGSLFSYSTTSQFIGQNTFVNASGNQVAKNTGLASIYAQSAGVHQFASAPSVTANSTQTFTTILEFSKGKTLALESATSVSGTGISFPSTQSASTDANTLDDYEEGTWTPLMVPDSGSITTQSGSGTYIKIGKSVFVDGIVTLTTVGTASGASAYNNFPFAARSFTGAKAAVGVSRENGNTGVLYQIYKTEGDNDGGVLSTTNGSINWQNGNKYTVSLTYSTA